MSVHATQALCVALSHSSSWLVCTQRRGCRPTGSVLRGVCRAAFHCPPTHIPALHAHQLLYACTTHCMLARQLHWVPGVAVHQHLHTTPGIYALCFTPRTTHVCVLYMQKQDSCKLLFSSFYFCPRPSSSIARASDAQHSSSNTQGSRRRVT